MPEHRKGCGRCLLAALLLAAAPVLADTGSDWFDAQGKALRHGLGWEDGSPAGGRVRFMACGYVAPGLAAPERGGGDGAYARMLRALRERLRSLGAAPRPSL